MSRREEMEGGGPPPPTIGAAVNRLLRARGLEEAAVLADVQAVWVEAVGAEVAAHVSPVALHSGELVADVDQAAWATQVQLLSSTLLARLAEVLGPGAPDRLRVRLGRPRHGAEQEQRRRTQS